MIFFEPSVENFYRVARNMRAQDYEEIDAVSWGDPVEEIVAKTMCCGQQVWCLGLEVPICVIGAVQVTPTLWHGFMYATEEFPQIGLSASRFAKRGIIGLLLDRGMLRTEARTLATNYDAQEWLEMLGAELEARTPAVGKRGEAFYLYGLTRDGIVRRRERSEEGG